MAQHFFHRQWQDGQNLRQAQVTENAPQPLLLVGRVKNKEVVARHFFQRQRQVRQRLPALYLCRADSAVVLSVVGDHGDTPQWLLAGNWRLERKLG